MEGGSPKTTVTCLAPRLSFRLRFYFSLGRGESLGTRLTQDSDPTCKLYSYGPENAEHFILNCYSRDMAGGLALELTLPQVRPYIYAAHPRTGSRTTIPSIGILLLLKLQTSYSPKPKAIKTVPSL